ncbi:hypothetical protein AC629_42240 [Bradyrhizobium sp. NAS80.1]|uniref:hypothetical protein n=1 Tax=Bradyrhizobium sp. NAS80.1 TaxID=1680159 RepID=UPI00095951AA|nr:hypothetical protein [Bradyrhizobium sp. NAS80.1]OKO68259.1 hypothetical protein AC629_42240 [Bradyrhizobium sp. NAS80.1]
MKLPENMSADGTAENIDDQECSLKPVRVASTYSAKPEDPLSVSTFSVRGFTLDRCDGLIDR